MEKLTDQQLAETIAYILRRELPRPKMRDIGKAQDIAAAKAALLAGKIVRQLAMSRIEAYRLPPLKQHSSPDWDDGGR